MRVSSTLSALDEGYTHYTLKSLFMRRGGNIQHERPAAGATHTHAFRRPLSFRLCHQAQAGEVPIPDPSHTHTHTHAHTRTHPDTYARAHTHTLTHSLTHPHSVNQSHTHSRTHEVLYERTCPATDIKEVIAGCALSQKNLFFATSFSGMGWNPRRFQRDQEHTKPIPHGDLSETSSSPSNPRPCPCPYPPNARRGPSS